MTTLRFAGQDYSAKSLDLLARQGQRVNLDRTAIKTITTDSNHALRSYGTNVVVHHEGSYWLLLGKIPDAGQVQVMLVSKPLLRKAIHTPTSYQERRENQLANRGVDIMDWRHRR